MEHKDAKAGLHEASFQMRRNNSDALRRYSVEDPPERAFKESRKINSAVDPKEHARHVLFLTECQKRGVRFLPAQVMRPLYQAAGL